MKPVDIKHFAIQHRHTHESPWLKPEGKLSPVEDEWRYSCWDFFGKAFNPHVGTGNDWRPKSKKADADRYKVWLRCGKQGFTKLAHALAAKAQARIMSDKGEFDSYDGYKNHCRAYRYEFRIVQCHLVFESKVLSNEDEYALLFKEQSKRH